MRKDILGERMAQTIFQHLTIVILVPNQLIIVKFNITVNAGLKKTNYDIKSWKIKTKKKREIQKKNKDKIK